MAKCEFLFLYFRRLFSKTPHLDCTVGPVTSASRPSSRKERTLRKSTRLSGAVEESSTTDQYIEIDLAGLGRMKFDPWHQRSMERREHSFLATFVRLEKLKTNSATFLSFVHFNKIVKISSKKGVNDAGFVASQGVRLQPRSTLALPTGSAVSK